MKKVILKIVLGMSIAVMSAVGFASDCIDPNFDKIFKNVLESAEKLELTKDEVFLAVKSGVQSDRGVAAWKSRTRPSIPQGSKPKGEYEAIEGDREKKRAIKRQNESSDMLADKGYDTEMLAIQKDSEGNNIPSPDLNIAGNVFDVYSPSTANSNKIRNEISSKVKTQADRIVLNIEDSNVTIEEVKNILYRKPVTNLQEIIIINNGELVHLFPF